MTKQQAINFIKYRIDTASTIAGKGENGKAFEDLEIAIAALEELNLYEQGGLCLIPSDVYEKQCEELDRLKEKDTSKKIRMLFDNEMKTNWCLCPNCNNSLGWEHTVISQYCSKCGQKIER